MKKYSMTITLLFFLIFLLSACSQKPTDEPGSTATTQESTSVENTSATETTSTAETTSAAETIVPLQVSDYFPFTANVHMNYKGVGFEYAEYQTYVDYLDNSQMQIRSMNPGTVSVLIYKIENGELKKVYSEGEFYYRLNVTGLTNTNDILIKEPVEVGNSWKLPDDSIRSITADDALVEVPYGTFHALEITTYHTDTTERHYYVKGLGLVKSDFFLNSDPATTISSLLETVETDVSFSQTVRIYHPDFNNDRLVYVSNNLELYTNETPLSEFESLLREVPDGSGLQPVISNNTILLGIDYNRDAGIVTVNFSSEFISEMNAGAQLESMLLSSVANTFGHYYQTNKVIITIEGTSYSSGHFYFENGEYLNADWENIPAW